MAEQPRKLSEEWTVLSFSALQTSYRGRGSYRRPIVGGTLEFPGHLIASLLVAQWLEHCLVAQVQFLACLVQKEDVSGTNFGERLIKKINLNWL